MAIKIVVILVPLKELGHASPKGFCLFQKTSSDSEQLFFSFLRTFETICEHHS